jgi:hypothetical protein
MLHHLEKEIECADYALDARALSAKKIFVGQTQLTVFNPPAIMVDAAQACSSCCASDGDSFTAVNAEAHKFGRSAVPDS